MMFRGGLFRPGQAIAESRGIPSSHTPPGQIRSVAGVARSTLAGIENRCNGGKLAWRLNTLNVPA